MQIVNLKETISGVKKLSNQTRFACAVAINDTLKDAQRDTVDRLLPDKFTLRAKGAPWQKPGNKLGFNAKFATKDKLEGTLGSAAEWLRIQEKGGVKSVAGHDLAIPSTAYKPKPDILEKTQRPRALLANLNQLKAQRSAAKLAGDQARAKKLGKEFGVANKAQRGQQGAFIATIGGLRGMYRRIEEGSRRLKLLFSLEKSAPVKPVLTFEKTESEIADKRFPDNFRRRFIEFTK